MSENLILLEISSFSSNLYKLYIVKQKILKSYFSFVNQISLQKLIVMIFDLQNYTLYKVKND